jgi:hypothetical protein
MNFKQFFTEAEDIKGWCEIEDITKEGMFGPKVIKAWSIIRHWRHGGHCSLLETSWRYNTGSSQNNQTASAIFQ